MEENPDDVKALRIAEEIKMVHATVLYHFPDGVREAVAAYAIETGESQIISQLVLGNHPLIKGMPLEERQRHLNEAAAAQTA